MVAPKLGNSLLEEVHLGLSFHNFHSMQNMHLFILIFEIYFFPELYMFEPTLVAVAISFKLFLMGTF